MKLFLHWLRWDLRRFRLLLLAWMIVLTAFFGSVAWQNAHPLRLEPDNPIRNAPFAVMVALFGFFFVQRVFSSDPSAGCEAHWKTLPPAGTTVGAVKLFIVFAFFIVLPMSAWWLVLRGCGLTPDPVACRGMSWMELIWWSQSLVIGALAIAAAGTKGVAGTSARLLTGALLIAIWHGGSWTWNHFRQMETSRMRRLDFWEPGYMPRSIRVTWPWLAAGGVLLLLGRRRSPAGAWLNSAALILPAGLVVAGPIWSWNDVERFKRINIARLLPGIPKALVDKVDIHLQGQGFRRAISIHHLNGRRKSLLGLRLKITGKDADELLTEGVRLGNEGRAGVTIRFLYGGILESQIFGPASVGADGLTVYADLDKDVLRIASMQACQIEGDIIINQRPPEIRRIPLIPGAGFEAPGMQAEISRLSPEHYNQSTWLVLEISRSFHTHSPDIWLEHKITRERSMPDSNGTYDHSLGFFIEPLRDRKRITSSIRKELPEDEKFRDDFENGRLDQWQLAVAWDELGSRVALPFKLDSVLIPRHPEDKREPSELIDRLQWEAGVDAAFMRQTLKHAFQLSLVESDDGASAAAIARTKESLTRLLAQVTQEHLEVLLSLVEEDPLLESGDEAPFDDPLRARIMELLTPEKRGGLRSREVIADYLKPLLRE